MDGLTTKRLDYMPIIGHALRRMRVWWPSAARGGPDRG